MKICYVNLNIISLNRPIRKETKSGFTLKEGQLFRSACQIYFYFGVLEHIFEVTEPLRLMTNLRDIKIVPDLDRKSRSSDCKINFIELKCTEYQKTVFFCAFNTFARLLRCGKAIGTNNRFDSINSQNNRAARYIPTVMMIMRTIYFTMKMDGVPQCHMKEEFPMN